MAACMKVVDLGDGVSIICDLRFGHAGECRLTCLQMGGRCMYTRDTYPRGCIRSVSHGGPHKFGDERAAKCR